jgi:predicted RNase H-like nuclease (RuvC/YqgF family)
MAEGMRKLANVLMEASNVARENERLQRDMNSLKLEIDRDKQRRIISELKTQVREDQQLIEALTAKNKRLKQKAGAEKHRADMLEVQLEKLIKRVQGLGQPVNSNVETSNDSSHTSPTLN